MIKIDGNVKCINSKYMDTSVERAKMRAERDANMRGFVILDTLSEAQIRKKIALKTR